MRSILITGAALGFGRGPCEVFVHRGWRVPGMTRSDADGTAAKGYLNFLESATPEGNGRFFDLVSGEIPW